MRMIKHYHKDTALTRGVWSLVKAIQALFRVVGKHTVIDILKSMQLSYVQAQISHITGLKQFVRNGTRYSLRVSTL